MRSPAGEAEPLRTTNNASVGADAYIAPNRIFPAPMAGHAGPALQKPCGRRHPCVPPTTALLVICHCETSAHAGCGNPHPPSPKAPLPKGPWHGKAVTGGFHAGTFLSNLRRGRWSCCGAQNFCAALRWTLEILTAATRSLRFLCHRQRSVRSPHRPAHRTTNNVSAGRGALPPSPTSAFPLVLSVPFLFNLYISIENMNKVW